MYVCLRMTALSASCCCEFLTERWDFVSGELRTTAAGLTVGDPVLRRKQPLSVELGPGIMGTIFDGIQRPLEYIARGSGDVFVPRGVDVPALDRHALWQYTPQVRVGDLVSGGDVFGTVRCRLMNPHLH